MQAGAGTILREDSLDLLAAFMGKGGEVAALTNQAMDGSMNMEQVCALHIATPYILVHTQPAGCHLCAAVPQTGTCELMQTIK